MIVNEITLGCAFRYALGRMTYVVQDVVSDIISNWDNIHENTKERFVKEIEEYRKQWEKCGHDCDDREWQKIIDLYNSKKPTE
jgi:hypothetical protein